MIKNISDDLVHLMWGGVSMYISPNQAVDVLKHFKADGNELKYLEDRFVNKASGKLVKGENFVIDNPEPQATLKEEEPVEEIPEKKHRGRPRKG